MNEWPAEWFRGDNAADRGDGEITPSAGTPGAGHPSGAIGGAGVAGAGAGGVAGASGLPSAAGVPGAAAVPNDPTVRLPPGAAASGSAFGSETRAPGVAWPDQPPLRTPPGKRGPAQAGGGRRRRPRLRLVLAFLAGLVVVLLILVIAGYFYLDGKIARENALVPTSNVSSGTNWLISGAPGQVTRRQERSFHIGRQQDLNSDTILLLHLPANGNPPVLVSIPRDSYVPIPGYGMNKINAAMAFGGAKLLVRTVQNLTGLQINHYINIGYVGLVNAVNAVGGVTLCLQHGLHDQASGVRLKKGCDNVSGRQALAFVRTRHQFLTQDLQREQNQRVFIKALISKMLSPGTLLNPFAIFPAASASASALTVDQGTHLKDLISVAFALRNPETTTLPVANANYFTQNAGDAVQLNMTLAQHLFSDLRTDHHVPKSLLTGSHLQA